MNVRRLLLSLAVLVFAGSVVAGGTGAFFSDEETSSGNVFAAGELDLQVDSVAHINGLVCFGDQWVPDDQVEWDGDAEMLVEAADANIGQAIIDYNEDFPANVPAAGDQCASTWTLTDLGPGHTFFNYGDLKPGDSGENTISLHVFDNDAYMCAAIHDVASDDNGCNEPETDAEETANGGEGTATCGDGEGELAQELNFFVWEDDGDNIYETNGDDGDILVNGDDGTGIEDVYPLYTPGTGVFTGGETQYLGVYWCYGEFTMPGGVLTCDGSSATNLTQSDSLTAGITFYVEQARSNDGFECPRLEEFEEEPTAPTLPDATVSSSDGWSDVDTDTSDGEGVNDKWEWLSKLRNNTGGFELQVGVSDSDALLQDEADTTWAADTYYPFTLSYDGSNTATLTANGESVSYPVGNGTFDRLGINAKAPAAQGGDSDVTTEIVSLSLSTVNPLSIDTVSATGVGSNDVNSITIETPTLSDAWVLTGEFKFTSVGGLYTSDEYPAVQFSID